MELELKRGDSGALFKLARTLAEQVPIQLSVKSKAERGYALMAGKDLGAVKAAPVALTPNSSREAAFRPSLGPVCTSSSRIGRGESGDSEAVHQIRVALRRMRAAISLFADMLSDPQTQEMKAEFKWIGGELAPARELDVFIK